MLKDDRSDTDMPTSPQSYLSIKPDDIRIRSPLTLMKSQSMAEANCGEDEEMKDSEDFFKDLSIGRCHLIDKGLRIYQTPKEEAKGI